MTNSSREIFLLGAGASKDAGIPLSYEMSKNFLTFERPLNLEQEAYHRVLHAMKFIAGGLTFQTSVEGGDPFSGVDVEAMFNAADFLEHRYSFEWAPFISSYHPLIERFEESRLIDVQSAVYAYHAEFDQLLVNAAKGRIIDARAMNNALTNAIRLGSARGRTNIFALVKDVMKGLLKNYVWLDPQSENSTLSTKYLENLVKYCKNHNCRIVTLNYDNTVEIAASSVNISVSSGVSTWNSDRKLIFENGKLHLIKLHGSIDWGMKFKKSTDQMPIQHFELIVENPNSPDFRSALIFGLRNKLTTEGPYLQLLNHFKEELLKADILHSVGYSFRDEHVNYILMDWLNLSPTRKILIYSGPAITLQALLIKIFGEKACDERIINTGLYASECFSRLQKPT